MPAKFREDLGEQFIVTRGIGECIFVLSKEEWTNFAAKLKTLPLTNQKAQYFMRKLYSSACEREADKQGRILLPQELREHAGIEKDAVVIGMESRVEIWSKEGWERYENEQSGSYDEVLEMMCEFGV